ncbi:Uncharacterised protein [Pannonibacter phragmitetus]|uniref:Uncharacterized protein n=1 Tax=Pannonibacter phragmitetus TaxID=121719 RepID=A0A378ZXR3_9HYPH|nr:RebB family R body protein [Pannonibacter phragmitetus]SUB01783.1 Uncharacterised protein [Pannonibacter phragmitetus]
MEGAEADGPDISAWEAGNTAQPVPEHPASLRNLLHVSTHHSTGLLFENARSAQENLKALERAARSGTDAPGSPYQVPIGFSPALIAPQSDVPDNMLSLLTVLNAFKSRP